VTALEPGPAGTVTAQVRRRVGDAAPMGADRVVLAAGAWSERLMMGAGPDEAAVRPIRGQQARFRGAAVPRHILRHGGFHAVPLAPPDGSTAEPPGSGTVLVGATVEEVGFEAEVTAAAGADFAAALASMLGPGQVLVEQRAGLRPKPRKGRPVIGPLPGCEQVIAATGHYKSGVLMAPLTGQVVARWALTGSPDRDMTCFAVHR